MATWLYKNMSNVGGPRNAQFKSLSIQNEVIEICGDSLSEQLDERENTSRQLTVTADETDVAGMDNFY